MPRPVSLILPLALVIASAGAAPACGGAPLCTVKDPTGTPLNVRKSAGGPILATLRNGQKIEFVEHVEIKGRKWARIAKYDPKVVEGGGWVLKSYLRCGAPQSGDGHASCVVRDPTGTPLNMRAEPNGAIQGSIRNGERVRVYQERVHEGKPWVHVERLADDNAIGYVFDAYLKCDEDGH